jgi:hypothetical protein
MIPNSSRLCLSGLLALGLLLGAGRVVLAQDPGALAKVKELNKKALEAYENLDPDEARKALMQALEVCATEGLNKHPLKATTHMNLGVILVGGFKQRESALRQFGRALEIEPGIKIPKRLTNPEIQAAFDAAAKEAGVGSKPEPAAETAGAADPPAPAEPTAAPSRDGPPENIKGIHHEPVGDAVPGKAVPIKAAVEAALGSERVVLAYRAEGASDFLTRDMDLDESGWYVARIPEPATSGKSVAYYIEARGRGGQPLASNGSSGEPHMVALGAPAAAVAQTKSIEEGDLAARATTSQAVGAGRLWLALGIGGGGGYAKGVPEVSPMTGRRSNDFAGVAPAQLMHFAPEIGYFLSPTTLLSLQGRLQLVTGATEVVQQGCKPAGVCEPAKGAVAVLAKMTWLLGSPGKLRPYVSLAAGGGDIRYLVSISGLRDCGPRKDQTCIDTVPGGRFFAGPAAGVAFSLSDSAFLTGSVNTLLGVPRTAFNVDVNLGLAIKI